MRILVCGGRGYRDRQAVFAKLDWIDRDRLDKDEPLVVIHGACPTGADRWADEWGAEHSVKVVRFPAAWRALGLAAGPIRNRRMFEEGKPDIVLAFPGNRGTANALNLARRFKVPVIEVPL